MKTVAIHDAKTNLSKYIAAAKKGETIYIGNHGKPEVELVIAKPIKKRQLGLLKGKIIVDDTAFDDHNDPEWQKMIEKMYNDPLSHE